MTYALVLSGAITAEGNLPRGAKRLDTGQWVTPPGGVWTDAQAALCGWLPVIDAPRPADTATTTSERSVTLVAGKPTVVWAVRDKTPGEIASATASTNEATLRADTTADLTKLKTSIDALALLLADDTTVGSIRNVMGPTGAVAGTTSLRALASQSNTLVINAASIKALIRLNIDLAQLAIDNAQANRRVARQTLRLAKAMVGDYATADVGTE